VSTDHGPLPSQRSPGTAAFEDLYRATVPQVRRYVEAWVGRGMVDDVLGDTYEVVLRRWEDLPEPPDERRRWVFGVARRTAQVSLRRDAATRRRTGELLAEPPVQDGTDALVANHRLSWLVSALPAKERDAMVLTAILDLSVTEAARVASCTVAAMSMRLTRARRRVADRLATEAGAEMEADDVR